MQVFTCKCGQSLFFGNEYCAQCGAEIGFDPKALTLVSVARRSDLKRCSHYHSPLKCNWLVPADDALEQCESCRLTRTLPPGTANAERLSKLEVSKRRWLYGLLRLGLRPVSHHQQPEGGLAFDFLEDEPGGKRVLTGHAGGVITLNVAEADPVERVIAREHLNEQYRTLVGHFRHESGHYFWDQLIRDTRHLAPFRKLFGDEQEDYAEALKRHYAESETDAWQGDFISHYAASHPWEDWAETWAHYLHLTDTMETAASFNMSAEWGVLIEDFDRLIAGWGEVAIMLNELTRSMGLNDGYPFVLQPPVISKLAFVHKVIRER